MLARVTAKAVDAQGKLNSATGLAKYLIFNFSVRNFEIFKNPSPKFMENQRKLKDQFQVTFGSCWRHIGIVVGSFWDHIGVTWDHLRMTLGSFWDQFGHIPTTTKSQAQWQIVIFP